MTTAESTAVPKAGDGHSADSMQSHDDSLDGETPVAETRDGRSLGRRLLREPLVHFLVLGALVFALYRILSPRLSQASTSHEIVLTMDDLRQLEVYFASQWKREPTPEEFRGLIENKVQEEILYREALAMGLDKDDTIVKRRMAQKMQFLAEDVAASHEPTSAELRAWFEKNVDKFTLSGRITFRHLYFSPDRRGARAREDALRVLGAIGSEPQDSKKAAAMADPFMYQDYYADRTPEQLGKEFGPQFAMAVFRLAPGGWRGPVESGYGWHVVYVESLTAARAPVFEEVEPDVKTAWLAEQKQLAWSRAYEAMRAKYTLLLPAPPPDTAASGSPPAAGGAGPKADGLPATTGSPAAGANDPSSSTGASATPGAGTQ